MFAFLVRYHLAASLELCHNIQRKEIELNRLMEDSEQKESYMWEDSWEPSGYLNRHRTLNCSTPSFERSTTVSVFGASQFSSINSNDQSYHNIRDLVSISSDESTCTDDYVPDDFSFFGPEYMGLPCVETFDSVPSFEEMDSRDFIDIPNDDAPADASGSERTESANYIVVYDEDAHDGVAPVNASGSERTESADYVVVYEEDTRDDAAPVDASVSERQESQEYVVVHEEDAPDCVAPAEASGSERMESPDVIVIPDEVAPDDDSSVTATASEDIPSFEKSLIDSSDLIVGQKKKNETSFKEEEQSSFEEGEWSFKGESSFEQGESSFEQGESSFEEGESSFEEGASSFEEGLRLFSWSFPPVAPPAHTLPIPKWVLQKPEERPQPVYEDIYRNPMPEPSHAPDFYNTAEPNGSNSSNETDQRRIPVVPNEPLKNWIRASIPEIAMPNDEIWFPMPQDYVANAVNFQNSVWSAEHSDAAVARENLLNHKPNPGEDRVALFFKHFELGTIPPPSKW